MRIHFSSSIGGVLRDARLGLGMSQVDLAGMLGITPQVLNRVEHGIRGFDTDWLDVMPAVMAVVVERAISAEVAHIAST